MSSWTGASSRRRRQNAILPGTTRGVILELAGREGIPSERRPVTEGELRSADELLIASAGGGIRAISTLDGRPVGSGAPGPVYRKIPCRLQGHAAGVLDRAAGMTDTDALFQFPANSRSR